MARERQVRGGDVLERVFGFGFRVKGGPAHDELIPMVEGQQNTQL